MSLANSRDFAKGEINNSSPDNNTSNNRRLGQNKRSKASEKKAASKSRRSVSESPPDCRGFDTNPPSKGNQKSRRSGKGIIDLKSHRFPDSSEWFVTGSRLHRGIYLKNDSAMPAARQRLYEDLKTVTDARGELETLGRYAGSIDFGLISALIESPYSWCDCLCLDFGDLQIKCHAPKNDNPNIAFEFYGSVSSDCFGFNYTRMEAVQILVAFFASGIGHGKVYRRHWRNILKAAGVESRAAFDRGAAS